MKTSTMSIGLATALLSMNAAQASEFKGGYLDGKIGYNSSSPATTNTSDEIYPGVEIGYGWEIDNILIGLDGFADSHTKSVTARDYGADVRLGFPNDKFMPYAKLGLAGSRPGSRAHYGLGIEYKFATQLSVVGEWTTDSKTVNSQKEKNSNISVGISFYLDVPSKYR